MERLVLAMVVILSSTTLVYGLTDPSYHTKCFDDNSTMTVVKSCHESLLGNYEVLYITYHATLDASTDMQNEIDLWKNKYNHLLIQQNNMNIQDQIINLTERVTAVENKTATNEGLIYKIQNIVRTIQVDIADIFLKINSVR